MMRATELLLCVWCEARFVSRNSTLALPALQVDERFTPERRLFGQTSAIATRGIAGDAVVPRFKKPVRSTLGGAQMATQHCATMRYGSRRASNSARR
jgi:hypothetical protein